MGRTSPSEDLVEGRVPSTAAISDAAVQLGIDLAPPVQGLLPVHSGQQIFGPALPVQLAALQQNPRTALESARGGEIIVIDNHGRTDAACVGDVIAHRCLEFGISGLVVWGAHRDTSRLRVIDLPVFSLGCCPQRTQRARMDVRLTAVVRVGLHTVGPDDLVFGDDDGVLFSSLEQARKLVPLARQIDLSDE